MPGNGTSLRLSHPSLLGEREPSGQWGRGLDDSTAWFAQTLQLPAPAMLPAVAVPLARMTPDEAVEIWTAWREYAPSARSAEKAEAFASVLRRGVETVVCTAFPDVAWVAVGEQDGRVPESAWHLLVNDAPLTASMIRILVHAGDQAVLVHAVQRRGERVPRDERGPFLLP